MTNVLNVVVLGLLEMKNYLDIKLRQHLTQMLLFLLGISLKMFMKSMGMIWKISTFESLELIKILLSIDFKEPDHGNMF